MTRQHKTADPQIKPRATPKQDAYIQYTIRIRKGSLAAQGLLRHAQRFNSRYEAGWIATLIEEFYILLDSPDPRGSLLYPLIYHRFESTTQPPSIGTLPPAVNETMHEEEQESDIDLTEIQDMSKNLQGYFDET